MGGHKRAYFGERVAEFVCRPPRTRVVVKLWSHKNLKHGLSHDQGTVDPVSKTWPGLLEFISIHSLICLFTSGMSHLVISPAQFPMWGSSGSETYQARTLLCYTVMELQGAILKPPTTRPIPAFIFVRT